MSEVSQAGEQKIPALPVIWQWVGKALSPTLLVPLLLLGAACTWWLTFREVERYEISRVSDHHKLLAANAAHHVDTAFLSATMSLIASVQRNGETPDLDNLSPYGFLGVCVGDSARIGVTTACASTDNTIWVHSFDAGGMAVTVSEVFSSQGESVVLVSTDTAIQSITGVLSLDAFRFIQSQIEFGEGGHATIFDASGRVIAHPNEEWELQVRDLSSVSIVAETLGHGPGVSRFYSPAIESDMVAGHAYASVPAWGIIVPQPSAELSRTARQVANRSVLPMTLGVLALCVMLLSMIKARSRLLTLIDDALDEIDDQNSKSHQKPTLVSFIEADLGDLANRLSKVSCRLKDARKMEAVWRSQLEGHLSIARDLAQSEKQRRQLVETSIAKKREEALGQLVGSVAHDVNNDLSIIRAHVDAIQQDPDAQTKRISASLEEILKATEKGKSLTRQLLSSSGRSKLEPTLVDPLSALRDAQSAVRSVVPENVQFSLEVPEDSPWILADPNQLQVALANLVLNASEAMDSDGVISFKLSVIRIDPSTRDPYQLSKPPVCVRFTISDDGRGMSLDELSRAKEPFFTSKKFGAGSGLGLPMVASFAQRSGGCLRLESEVGAGTSAHLTFPAHEFADGERPDAPKELTDALQITEKTVFLVEDEPPLRLILKAVMERQGCHVEAFECADDAVKRLEEGAVPDVVITDMVMPGELQGDGLIAYVRDKLGDLPIVVMSGYSDSINKDRFTYDGRLSFIQKPVSATDLLNEAEALLRQA